MITDNIIGFSTYNRSNRYIQALDQVTGNFLDGKFSVATIEDVHEAVVKAHKAWPVFRSLRGEERARFLTEIANRLEEIEEELSRRIGLETAYPSPRIKNEFIRTVNQVRMFAAISRDMQWRDRWWDHAIPDRSPAPRPELRRVMMAIGPVVVFGASNFPLAYSTAGGDTVSALCVGCPVIVKAHDSHLGTHALVSEAIMHAAQDTNMPEGVFSSLYGDAFTTGEQLVTHPLVSAVGFTGSLKGGRAIFDLANNRENPIPVFAEMGSVNPVFILPSALSDSSNTSAKQLAGSLTITAGQFCTKPGLIILQEGEKSEAWIRDLHDELTQVPPFTLLNPGIAKNFHRSISGLNGKGVTLLKKDQNGSQMVEPVLARTTGASYLADPSVGHEIFGPFGLLVVCKNYDEMVRVALQLEGQLTTTIHADENDIEHILVLREILAEKSGRVIWNGVPTGVEVVHSITHGGPYPASTDVRFTAVGHDATRRWLRPVTFQNWPSHLLPGMLK